MTFEQFQATGRDVTDIESIIPDAVGARAGRVYCGDLLHIEDTDDWADGGQGWIDGDRPRWYLIIANMEYAGELEELERRLYGFAVSEGYEIR